MFLDPNGTTLKISDGITTGGTTIGGGGDTGSITFSGSRIIGDYDPETATGTLSIVPSLNVGDGGEGSYFFERNGQYLDVYASGNDEPHVHISAGILSTSSAYYNPVGNYLKGDLYLGDEGNYVTIKGDGTISINSDNHDARINFNTGVFNKKRIALSNVGNFVSVYENALDFDGDFCIPEPDYGYVGVGETGAVYTSSGHYKDGINPTEVGSAKIVIQGQSDAGDCQLSELLVVRPFNGTTVFMTETGRVSSGVGNTSLVTFEAHYDSVNGNIRVFANTTPDPNTSAWSFNAAIVEIRQFID